MHNIIKVMQNLADLNCRIDSNLQKILSVKNRISQNFSHQNLALVIYHIV